MLLGLAILGGAIAAFDVWPSLVASAPSSSSAEVGQSTGTQPAQVPAPGEGAPPRGRSRPSWSALDDSDGVIPDGVVVSAFDEEIPAVGKLDRDLLDALRQATTDAEGHGIRLQVNSGWRSPEYQQQLLQDAVAKHGSQEEAARWAATPETSAHVPGEAVDIGPVDAASWLSEHGARYGLCQIYRNEPWHFELRPDAVDDGCPPMYADPTEDPRMQP